MPNWLIICIGIAVIIALAGKWIFLCLVAIGAVLVAVILSAVLAVGEAFEALMIKSGFHRWQHQRRVKSGYYRKRFEKDRRR